MGLLSGAARLARAVDQGFDVDNPIYHGTSSENIDAFNRDLIGSANDEGFYGSGIYFASSPGEARFYGPNVGKYYKRGKYLDLSNDSGDLSFLGHFKDFAPKLDAIGALSDTQKQALKSYQKADKYIDENISFIKTQDGDKEGIGARLKVDGPVEELLAFRNNRGLFSTKEEAIENLKFQFYRHLEFNEREKYPGIGDEAASLSDYVRTELGASNLTKAAQDAGFDGIVYGDETVVFDPKNIRSADAEFDPEKTQSSNLLASPAPAAIGAGLLAASSEPTTRDKAVAVGEVARQAMGGLLATPGAALQTIIQATTNDAPTSQLEANFERMASRPEFQPQTQLGKEYSEAAQKGLLDVMRGPLAAGSAIVEPLSEAASLLPRRARLVGRSLLDLL